MPGIELGPTTGFWNRFRTAMPGALNNMAQVMGPGYMQPMAKATSSMVKKPTPPNTPKADVPTDAQMKGSGQTGNRSSVNMGNGIVRPYGGFGFGMGQLPIMQAQSPMNMGNAANGMMGGLWNAYNRLSGIGANPQGVNPGNIFY